MSINKLSSLLGLSFPPTWKHPPSCDYTGTACPLFLRMNLGFFIFNTWMWVKKMSSESACLERFITYLFLSAFLTFAKRSPLKCESSWAFLCCFPGQCMLLTCPLTLSSIACYMSIHVLRGGRGQAGGILHLCIPEMGPEEDSTFGNGVISQQYKTQFRGFG